MGERSASIRHMADAQPRDVLGLPAVDAATAEQDFAPDAYPHIADRAQDRGLAGAVGAEQGGDAAFGDGKVDTIDDLRLAIGDREVLELEDRAHAAVPR